MTSQNRFRSRFPAPIAGLLALLALVACGTEHPGEGSEAGGAGPAASGSLLPWAVGNRWTYQVTEDGEVSTKVNTIGEQEPVGGEGPNADVVAYQVTTSKKNGTDRTESWQAPDGDRIVRYRERSYSASTGELVLEEHWDPSKLHIDWSAEHLGEGATWIEEYEETKLPVGEAESQSTRRDRWTVRAVAESITVPAGRFDAVVFQKVGSDTPKTYWYVPGVGKVKETGGQTEELVEYELSP